MKKVLSAVCIILVLAMMTSPVSAAKKDTKAPVITKTNPAVNGSDIMIEGTIVIRFSEKIQKGKSFNKIGIQEMETKNIGYSCKIKGNLLTITPKADLKYASFYTFTIPAGAVEDSTGNVLKTAYSGNFFTEKDPTAASGTEDNQAGIKYSLQMEAFLDHELTDYELEYFEQLIKMFGIDAKFTEYHKEDTQDEADE